MAEVCAGNLDITFQLRRRDDLKDLAESLNLLIAELRNCVHTLQEDQVSRAACIAELEALVEANKIDSDAADKIITALRKSGEEAARAIEKYSR